jgi:hypothetical protein
MAGKDDIWELTTDDEGLIPQLRLSCEGSEFVLGHEPLS